MHKASRNMWNACPSDCACNFRHEGLPTLEELQVLREVRACMWAPKVQAEAKVHALLQRILSKCDSPASRRRAAYVLSVPVTSFGSGVTFTHWCIAAWDGDYFRDVSLIEALLNLGPCLRLGMTTYAWRVQGLTVPVLTSLLHTKTVLDGVLTASRLTHRKSLQSLLLLAGGLPSPWPSWDTRLDPGQEDLWREQWRAWHARKGRRLWVRFVWSSEMSL
jgi:hypothetical protein